MEKHLIYILNHYSTKEASHLYHIIGLLREINSRGFRVTLILEKGYEIPECSVDTGFNSFILSNNKVMRVIKLNWVLIRQRLKGKFVLFVRISKSSGVIGSIMGRIYGFNVYFWQSGTTQKNEFESRGNYSKLMYFLSEVVVLRFIALTSHRFVTGPESMLRYYSEYLGIRRKNLSLLYNDIDVNRFSPVVAREKVKLKKKLDLPLDKKILVFVKRLSPVKGVHYYLREILPNLSKECMILVIGNGSELRIIQELSYKYGSNLRVIGAVENKLIQEYYQVADLSLNLSLEEGFPRVLLESFACGVPTISTNVGGILDVIKSPALRKYVFRTRDTEGILRAIDGLMSDSDEARVVSKLGRELANRYSTENVAKMYIKELFS